MDSSNLIPQQLIDDLGIGSLPEETQADIVTKLGESILRRSTIALLERLPEADREAFGQITDSGDTEKANAFLREHIPDTDTIVQDVARQEVADFKKAIAG